MFFTPRHKNDTHMVDCAANGSFVFHKYGPPLKVQAAVDASPGDWKTALIRGHTGIKTGEIAILYEIWHNCYGKWATIEFNDIKFDVRLYELKLLEVHDTDANGRTISIPYSGENK